MTVSPPTKTASPADRREWWREVEALDVAVYAAISATPTPTLDRHLAAISRAAVDGLASLALTSTVVNVGLKSLGRRRRPDRAAYHVPVGRQVAMPRTTSFPSGHAASAAAFATGVAHELPTVGIPLQATAAVVGYSRVHTGVHYPLDVIAGSVVGAALAPVACALLDRRRRANSS
jgi:membrane-associated phospholipid phosphatase